MSATIKKKNKGCYLKVRVFILFVEKITEKLI